ncbi:MAG: hypothetical protein ACK4I8_01355 [Armatimonadota bacterium]
MATLPSIWRYGTRVVERDRQIGKLVASGLCPVGLSPSHFLTPEQLRQHRLRKLL